MSTIRETWISAKFSGPTRNWNWRMASTNGADSISPTVPPSWMAYGSRTGHEIWAREVYLDNADIRLLSGFIHWDFGDPLHPVLYSTSDMWYYLLLPVVEPQRPPHYRGHEPGQSCQDSLLASTRLKISVMSCMHMASGAHTSLLMTS
jgi:hypothetical protein